MKTRHRLRKKTQRGGVFEWLRKKFSRKHPKLPKGCKWWSLFKQTHKCRLQRDIAKLLDAKDDEVFKSFDGVSAYDTLCKRLQSLSVSDQTREKLKKLKGFECSYAKDVPESDDIFEDAVDEIPSANDEIFEDAVDEIPSANDEIFEDASDEALTWSSDHRTRVLAARRIGKTVRKLLKRKRNSSEDQQNFDDYYKTKQLHVRITPRSKKAIATVDKLIELVELKLDKLTEYITDFLDPSTTEDNLLSYLIIDDDIRNIILANLPELNTVNNVAQLIKNKYVDTEIPREYFVGKLIELLMDILHKIKASEPINPSMRWGWEYFNHLQEQSTLTIINGLISAAINKSQNALKSNP